MFNIFYKVYFIILDFKCWSITYARCWPFLWRCSRFIL